MFIKWHVYQRQIRGKKTDKYTMQPILTQSYRLSKKTVKKGFMEHFGVSEQEFEERWTRRGNQMNRSQHQYIFKFPRFPSCAYVYYDKPRFIEQRRQYWAIIDALLKSGMLSFISEKDKKMIVDEIERVLPRPTKELLRVLERAYSAGMPQEEDPEVFFTEDGYGVK